MGFVLILMVTVLVSTGDFGGISSGCNKGPVVGNHWFVVETIIIAGGPNSVIANVKAVLLSSLR